MTVKQCYDMFLEFAARAFTHHRGSKLPLLKYVIEICKKSKYNTQKLNAVLQDQFGCKKLFGECSSLEARKTDIKVGVTLTSPSGDPCIATNYNRPTDSCTDSEDGNISFRSLN